MYRKCMVTLAMFMLPTNVYSAAGIEEKRLICASESFIVVNSTWRSYTLKFMKGELNVQKSFIGTKQSSVEYIQCPKDFDVVSLCDAYTGERLVAYMYREIERGGIYTICGILGIIPYFFDIKARRRLFEGKNVIYETIGSDQQRSFKDKILPSIPPYEPCSVRERAVVIGSRSFTDKILPLIPSCESRPVSECGAVGSKGALCTGDKKTVSIIVEVGYGGNSYMICPAKLDEGSPYQKLIGKRYKKLQDLLTAVRGIEKEAAS